MKPASAARLGCFAWLAIAPLASGCATACYEEADDHYWQNDPEAVLAAYREAIDDRGQNALLGVEKMLSAALLRNDWRNAESLAIRASTLVNIFIAEEPGERDAVSLFGHEKDKPFKGEPHERVMADYYLGVLRFKEHDYEGALSAFRSAMNKDRGSFLMPVTKENAHRQGDNAERYIYDDDWALLHFLAAKCCQMLEEPEDAQRFFERACEARPPMKPLFEQGMDSRTNAIVLIEGGRAPYKRQTGPQGAILGYSPGPITAVEGVSIGDRELSYGLCEDLYYQATTIGGRQVDQINVVKAERQEILHAAGFATTAAGYMIAIAGSSNHNRNVEAAGLIALGVGIATMIFASAAIDPSADVRSWSTLPGQIFLAVGNVAPGVGNKLAVRANGEGNLSQEWLDLPVDDGINLYWTRLLPERRGGSWMPPPEPVKPDMAAPDERPQERSS